MLRTLVSAPLGDIEFLVMGKTVPSQEDWTAHCRRVRERIAAGQLGLGVLVVTDGGTPTTKQRAQFFGDFPPFARPRRIAVCTSSAVSRSVMTAVSWFGLRGLKAFLFEDVPGAYEWLQPSIPLKAMADAVDAAQRENGWRRIALSRARLPG